MVRCFISIDIPKEVKEKIAEIQLPGFFGKKIKLENLHLTLKFLGEIEEDKIEEVKKRLGEIKFEKLNCEIDSVGFFSPRFVRIIWVHLKGCENLQREIDEKLKGLFEKEDKFMSHITIARVKSLRDKKKFLERLEKIKIPRMEFVIDRFLLKKSVLTPEGPVYEILDVFNSE